MSEHSILMRALTTHDYYEPHAKGRTRRQPGEQYEIHDSEGMTAEQFALWLTTVGWAIRVPASGSTRGADRIPAKVRR
jgi:hypothetical protein